MNVEELADDDAVEISEEDFEKSESEDEQNGPTRV